MCAFLVYLYSYVGVWCPQNSPMCNSTVAMRCRVLPCVAVCGIPLYNSPFAVCCSVLQCIAVCSMLQCNRVRCMCCSEGIEARQYSLLQLGVVCCSVLQHCNVWECPQGAPLCNCPVVL